MSKKFVILAGVVFIMFSNLYADEQKASTKVEQVSKQLGITIEDATKLMDNMQELAQLMGLKPAVTEEETKKKDGEKVTGPEVANKALDMAGNAMSTISAQIEKAAPHVWRIMIKQQYADAIARILLPLGLLIASIIYSKIAGKWKCEGKVFEGKDFTLVDFRALSRFLTLCISTLWLLVSMSGSIRYLINPEYYAIRDMFKIVLGIK